jgi:chemotaxis protein MotB
MAARDGSPTIVIKKVTKKVEGGHHGGAWKVAYADFVTAMMAFFLLMWLLNATTEKQRKGLADYFDPTIPISRISAGGSGVLQGDSVMTSDVQAGSATDGGRDARRDADGGPQDGRGTGEAGAEAAHFEAAVSAEEDRLTAVGAQIESLMQEAGGDLAQHFKLHLEPDGLVIEIVDVSDQPLFASGSAQPAELLPRLIEVLVPVLQRTLNPMTVVGHTDARPLARSGYGNWELSADRANAARRLMIASGMPEGRFAGVIGRAATQPISEDPLDPQNRRIAITLLRLFQR